MMRSKKCYAEGRCKNITCDNDTLVGFTFYGQGWICQTHYDILAKLQNKPSLEERQQKKVAGTLRFKDHPILASEKWWERFSLVYNNSS